MSQNAHSVQVVLIRKKRVLEKFSFSKSTLHDLMKRDESFPRPIYLNGGRIPYWREADIEQYIATSAANSQQVAPARTEQQSASSSNECIKQEAVVEAPHAQEVDQASFPPRAAKISTFEQFDANGRSRLIQVQVPKKRAIGFDRSPSRGWPIS